MGTSAVQAPRLLGPQPPTAVSRAEIPARTLLAPQPQTTLAEACVGELPPPTLLPLLHPSLDTTLRPPKMGFCTPSLSCSRNSSRTCSGFRGAGTELRAAAISEGFQQNTVCLMGVNFLAG